MASLEEPSYLRVGQQEDDSDGLTSTEDDPAVDKDNGERKLAMMRSFSFDLDDEEDDLRRYHFETDSFQKMSETEDLQYAFNGWRSRLLYVWKGYREARMEHRQRRTQELLNVHTKLEHFVLKLSSWCDIFDRGWSVLFALVLLWVGLCVRLVSQRALVFGGGLLFFVSRIGISLYFYSHHSRKRKITTSWEPIMKSSPIRARPAYRDQVPVEDDEREELEIQSSDEPITIQIV